MEYRVITDGDHFIPQVFFMERGEWMYIYDPVQVTFTTKERYKCDTWDDALNVLDNFNSNFYRMDVPKGYTVIEYNPDEV